MLSQSSWQIGRPDLNAGFLTVFFFPWVADVSDLSCSQIWNMELDLDEQDTRQNTELKKSVVQSVSLCLSYLFLFILTSKFIKNCKKIKQKNSKPWILLNQRRTEKQMRTAALRHRIYFFSLISIWWFAYYSKHNILSVFSIFTHDWKCIFATY